MSYHVEAPRFGFKELPDRILVREDGYLGAYKFDGEPIVDYWYVPEQRVDELRQELARRAEENICEEVLARLGYVKVVRCKECKQADIDQTEHEYREPLRCCLFHMNVKPDNFCCWACKEDE